MLISSARFCRQCHAILELPDLNNILRCRVCNFFIKASEFGAEETETKSRSRAERIIPRRQQLQAQEDSNFKRATVKEPCPKCAHPEMTFYTLQLRSVDEGQTVFYSCEKCGHNYSINT